MPESIQQGIRFAHEQVSGFARAQRDRIREFEIDGITCPRRDPRENYVGSSIQFSLIGRDETTIRHFLTACMNQGVELKWFGKRLKIRRNQHVQEND